MRIFICYPGENGRKLALQLMAKINKDKRNDAWTYDNPNYTIGDGVWVQIYREIDNRECMIVITNETTQNNINQENEYTYGLKKELLTFAFAKHGTIIPDKLKARNVGWFDESSFDKDCSRLIQDLVGLKKQQTGIERVPETLTFMYQRIKELRGKLAEKDIGREKALRLQQKMYKTIPVPDFFKRKIQQFQRSGDTNRFIWLNEKTHKFFVGSEYGTEYETMICDMGGMLETEDVGLESLLRSNGKYKRLKGELELQYSGAPQYVITPILKYERYLYGMSSVFLWNRYRLHYLGRQLPTEVEAKVSQFNLHKEDEMMNRLKEDVVKSIDKYLKS